MLTWQAKLWDLRHVDPKECLAVLPHGGVVNSAYFSPVEKHVSFPHAFSKNNPFSFFILFVFVFCFLLFFVFFWVFFVFFFVVFFCF